jgi:hypothetical protein
VHSVLKRLHGLPQRLASVAAACGMQTGAGAGAGAGADSPSPDASPLAEAALLSSSLSYSSLSSSSSLSPPPGAEFGAAAAAAAAAAACGQRGGPPLAEADRRLLQAHRLPADGAALRGCPPWLQVRFELTLQTARPGCRCASS